MKIGVFAYNFEHKKTQEGLMQLFFEDVPVECIFAADPVPLSFYQSKIRIAPKDLSYAHPKKIAEKLNIPYFVVKHNDKECIDLIQKHDLDLGVILGARILPQDIIEQFKIGVLNMHPGLLPQNRGLDNVKWAILRGFKQGVSTHLIDRNIDRGKLIAQKEISVYEDDTLLDIHLRIQNLELHMMIEAIRLLESGKAPLTVVEEGNKFKAVPEELEKTLLETFETYKKEYETLS